ncbi:conserved hypothetical protein [Hyella patelloides LEGE 07179]|uniref:Uncharacterized protein n=1 Tax=Hyella patelloides LEGE 07179 TaxID=945734 RepID=A0A563W4Y6_9CYAN|nr:hypothetical protein [Hyella patelloides]VEP18735.1 conserved hypothetical protein [Hyella patelloides LEGE 07179]
MNAHSKLIEKLVILELKLFTGTTTIITPDNKQWIIYLYQGMLLWAEGGSHVYRFWQRHLNYICPQANITLFEKERIKTNSSTDYYFINTLLKEKLASRKETKYLIEQRLENVLFDIFQAEHRQKLKINSQPKSAYSLLKKNLNLTLTPIATYQLSSKAYDKWSIWAGKGLTSCSPNLAPLLKKENQISQQISPIMLQNMKRMLNGKNTIRDLALQMDKDFFDVTCALVPYFFKGYVKFLEIPDLPAVNLPLMLSRN